MMDAKEYEGDEKIVISIDVGTTNSRSIRSTLKDHTNTIPVLHTPGAASYVYLYPGSRPEVRMVSSTAAIDAIPPAPLLPGSSMELMQAWTRLPNGQDREKQWEIPR
jgi:hypothetical protein